MLAGLSTGIQSVPDDGAGQCRITVFFRRANGRTQPIRKATRTEPEQSVMDRVLNIDPASEVCA